SKSRFLSGCQCPKKFYLDVFRKDLKPTPPPAIQHLLTQGNDIGLLARQYFPNGLDASPSDFSQLGLSIVKTKHWIEQQRKTIYEATFSKAGLFCMLDILQQVEDGYEAIEVKSTLHIKEYHILDGAYQLAAMKAAGFEPKRLFIMHLNPAYKRMGLINIQSLFTLTDITSTVKEKAPFIEQTILQLQRILQTREAVEMEMGDHCQKPFYCDYLQHCSSGMDNALPTTPQVHDAHSFFSTDRPWIYWRSVRPAVPLLNDMAPYQPLPYFVAFMSFPDGADNPVLQTCYLDPRSVYCLHPDGTLREDQPTTPLLELLKKALASKPNVLSDKEPATAQKELETILNQAIDLPIFSQTTNASTIESGQETDRQYLSLIHQFEENAWEDIREVLRDGLRKRMDVPE
ncbi:MAG: hypothetical protein ACKO5C_02855, partial [Ferruginibacter sp.]